MRVALLLTALAGSVAVANAAGVVVGGPCKTSALSLLGCAGTNTIVSCILGEWKAIGHCPLAMKCSNNVCAAAKHEPPPPPTTDEASESSIESASSNQSTELPESSPTTAHVDTAEVTTADPSPANDPPPATDPPPTTESTTTSTTSTSSTSSSTKSSSKKSSSAARGESSEVSNYLSLTPLSDRDTGAATDTHPDPDARPDWYMSLIGSASTQSPSTRQLCVSALAAVALAITALAV